MRSRRALDEFVVDGMPTVIPFHRVVVRDPAYVGASTPTGEGSFDVYTQWIETEFDNRIEPYGGDVAEADEPVERQTVVVEVGGQAPRGRPAGRTRWDLGRRRCRGRCEEAEAGRRQEGRCCRLR